MSEENQQPRDAADAASGEVHDADVAGSEEQTSDPVAQADELTVEDILNAEQSADAVGANAAAEDAPVEEPATAAEYLEDLRRITAEFANYRKRTEDNREIERQRATAAALVSLLSVLDDLDRAEKHGDLVEGSAFQAIAQKLRNAVEKLGLESFGADGEEFDPNRHEAITQVPTPGVDSATVLEVFERGYRIGDVELRAAKVVVAVPVDG